MKDFTSHACGVEAVLGHLARVYGERKRNFVGQHLWARGYLVSTVGRDEKVIRDYIRNQETEDQRIDQMAGGHDPEPFPNHNEGAPGPSHLGTGEGCREAERIAYLFLDGEINIESG